MLGLYYVAMIVLIVTVTAAHGLRRSRSGRLVIAIRDNERATEAFGISHDERPIVPIASTLSMASY